MTDQLPRGTSRTARVQDTTYDTWLTKAQAADAIGRSEKAVQRLAADGHIQSVSCQASGRGPFRTVYHPDDVARMAAARLAEPVAFVLPAGVTSPVNGNGHHDVNALTVPPAAPLVGPEQLAQFLCYIVDALQTVSRTSRTAAPLFLTIPEAAALSGLSQACLRKRISAGTLTAIRDRGWKIRRKDLEAL